MSIRTQRNSKRGVAAAVTAALGVSLLAMSSPAGATATASSVRVFGADRSATSVAISTAAAALSGAPTNKNTHFVIASASSYADSVTAAALAGSVGATIILLPSDGSLSTAAAARLVNATNVFIVGGPSVVPSTVEAAVQAATTPATVFTRLGGTNRFETAAAVASYIGSTATIGNLAAKRTVILVNSSSFADAVSVAPAAWKGVHPVLLTDANSLNASSKATIAALGAAQVLIVGGPSAVSAAVASEVDAMTNVDVVRVGGANRYETASLLASAMIKSVATGGFGFSAANVGLANLGESGGGADALAAAPYLGIATAPLLGVAAGSVPSETAAWLAANKDTTATLHVFGGTSAIADSTVTSALASAGKLPNPTAVISAKEKLATVTVVFSEPVSQADAQNTSKYQVLALNGAAITSPFSGIGTMIDASGGYGKTVVLTLATPATYAVAGNTIQVLGGTISTADGRKVDGASLVIAADTTAPTASLAAVIGTAGGNSDKFTVKFSEPVTTAATADMFTINGTDVTAITPTYTLAGATVASPSATTPYDQIVVQVTTPSALGQAETIALKAGKIKDAAGNPAAAASTVVLADSVKPTVVSVTSAITATGTAQKVFGPASNLLVQAKTAGVAGNAVTVEINEDTANTGTVEVTGTAIVLKVKATVTTTAAIVAAINASADASALITVNALTSGSASWVDASAANLAGGTSTLKLTTTYSEPILLADGSKVAYDADGALSVVTTVAGETAAPNAPVVSGATVVTSHLLTAANQIPAAINTATAGYTAGAVLDLGGNPLATLASKLIG